MPRSLRGLDDPTIARDRTVHRRCQRRWVKDRFGEDALILDRKTDDFRLLDCPVRRFLRGGDHKIAEAASLDLGRALDDLETVRADARFDPGRAGLLLGHPAILVHFTRMYGLVPNNTRGAALLRRPRRGGGVSAEGGDEGGGLG